MRVRTRGEEIRSYIVENVDKHPDTIGKVASEHFKITRQAVNKHLQHLVAENILKLEGNTRSRTYSLVPLETKNYSYPITEKLSEGDVWTSDIRPNIASLPENALEIWHYGFTEMFNNAIDHSGGSLILVEVERTASYTEIFIYDDGIGIFRKIKEALDLSDERHAVLELAKGKFTTDAKRHSGEGIFFSSKMFDQFSIVSGDVYFSHTYGEKTDWVMENKTRKGTAIFMKMSNHTSRIMRRIFDEYTSDDGNYIFNKTVIPVSLAEYGDDNLISRSQAKRLLARVDKFKVVIFNFSDVSVIGQAFADEIFRVFANEHPDMQIIPVNVNTEVMQMISRANPDIKDGTHMPFD